MAFDTYGFLGDEIERIAKIKYQENKDLFELAKSISVFSHEIKSRFMIHNEDSQELLIGALYIKVLQSYESTIILAQRGLEADSKSILRVLLESVFYLKAICIDREFSNDYIKGDDVERLRILYKVKKDDGGVFSDDLKDYAEKQDISVLKSSTWKKDDNPLDIYKVAQKAGMYDFYLLVYGTLCSEVHTSVRSLEKYYGLDKNGKVEYLECRPKYSEMVSIIITAGSILVTALFCTTEYFKIDRNEKLKSFNEHLNKYGMQVLAK